MSYIMDVRLVLTRVTSVLLPIFSGSVSTWCILLELYLTIPFVLKVRYIYHNASLRHRWLRTGSLNDARSLKGFVGLERNRSLPVISCRALWLIPGRLAYTLPTYVLRGRRLLRIASGDGRALLSCNMPCFVLTHRADRGLLSLLFINSD
jgi:hypothetical protein